MDRRRNDGEQLAFTIPNGAPNDVVVFVNEFLRTDAGVIPIKQNGAGAVLKLAGELPLEIVAGGLCQPAVMISFLEGRFSIDVPSGTLAVAYAVGEGSLLPLRAVVEKGVGYAVKGIGLALFIGKIVPAPFEGFHQRFFVQEFQPGKEREC